MADYKHGVYVNELATKAAVATATDLGVQVVVGTAPVNLADDPSKGVNVPKLCSSLDEAKAAVGYSENCSWQDYTLCQAIYESFVKFGVGPVVLINVLDPASHVTAVTQSEMTVTNKKCVISVFGVVKSTVVVKQTADGTALVEDTDYVLSFDSDDHLVVAILAGGAAASATSLFIAYSKLNPAAVTNTEIIGGTDIGTGADTGLALIRQIYPLFGVNAGLILAPGYSDSKLVATAMQSACSDINGCFSAECVCDIESTSTVLYSGVAAAKGVLGVTGAHTILCWPMWHEDVNGADKLICLSAAFAACAIANDMAHDEVPYLSPSNKELGEGYTCTAAGVKVLLDQPQANVVNGAGVVTALNLRGFRTWGSNTAAYPGTTDAKDRWISVRRFFTWWNNRFINSYITKIDENASRRMVETIVDDENMICNGYVARGYCPGAEISVDYAGSDFANGKLVFSQKRGSYPPAESIVNNVEADVSYLLAEFGGEQ